MVRITHPGHPLHGRSVRVQKVIQKENELFFGILLSDGTPALIPSSWTDFVEKEDSVYQETNALFRVQDLGDLWKLLDSLKKKLK